MIACILHVIHTAGKTLHFRKPVPTRHQRADALERQHTWLAYRRRRQARNMSEASPQRFDQRFRHAHILASKRRTDARNTL